MLDVGADGVVHADHDSTIAIAMDGNTFNAYNGDKDDESGGNDIDDP